MDVSQITTRYVNNFKLYLLTGNHLNVFTDNLQDAVWCSLEQTACADTRSRQHCNFQGSLHEMVC